MKNLIFGTLLFFTLIGYSQKPCEIETNVTDSLGTYKITKQSIIFERKFAGNTTNLFFALFKENGMIGLELQHLRSSEEFIKANCFDANSKIFLQLNNGKIVTLFFSGNDTCGTLLRNENNQNTRILVGTFLFLKNNYEELKSSPVTFIRISYSGENIDYPFKTQLTAEIDKKTYEPENYFIDYLNCVEN